jgi:hypothetical protein
MSHKCHSGARGLPPHKSSGPVKKHVQYRLQYKGEGGGSKVGLAHNKGPDMRFPPPSATWLYSPPQRPCSGPFLSSRSGREGTAVRALIRRRAPHKKTLAFYPTMKMRGWA